MSQVQRIFMFLIFFAGCGIIAVIPPLHAQSVWYVDDDAPGDPGPGDPTISDPDEDGSAAHPFDAIQEALDSASNGHTVLAADGTYTGDGNRDMNFNGKALTLQSAGGPDNCVIDCEGSDMDPHRAFIFENGENNGSTVEDFTIRNGYADGAVFFNWIGGGIYCSASSPTIRGNIFTRNLAKSYGGGIALYDNSAAYIAENTFYGNSGLNACAIYTDHSAPSIIDNDIYNNETSMSGSGGGIMVSYGSPMIAGNTITGNTAHMRGGGIL